MPSPLTRSYRQSAAAATDPDQMVALLGGDDRCRVAQLAFLRKASNFAYDESLMSHLRQTNIQHAQFESHASFHINCLQKICVTDRLGRGGLLQSCGHCLRFETLPYNLAVARGKFSTTFLAFPALSVCVGHLNLSQKRQICAVCSPTFRPLNHIHSSERRLDEQPCVIA